MCTCSLPHTRACAPRLCGCRCCAVAAAAVLWLPLLCCGVCVRVCACACACVCAERGRREELRELLEKRLLTKYLGRLETPPTTAQAEAAGTTMLHLDLLTKK